MFSPALVAIQALNGLQFGMMLFLFSAGLTLVLGIMNLINLAHGSQYMLGAYFAAAFFSWTGSLLGAVLLAIPVTFLAGIAIEALVVRWLYAREHLDHVLATFGLILFLNELVRIVWGPEPISLPVPEALSGRVTLLPGIDYPAYRLTLIGIGLAVAVLLYLVVSRTRLGMLIRAGGSNREMVEALGVDTRLLFTAVFGLGAVLAGLAGMAVGPLLSVEPGMGDGILVLALVTIVIGGIGSVRGSFIAAILIGMVDTVGRAFLPGLLVAVLPRTLANAVGPALASMLIYVLMASVLLLRPEGLFPAQRSGR